MLENFGAVEIAGAVLVILFACTVFSAMGFGIGIVGIPLMLFVLDPTTSVVVINCCAAPVVVLIVLRNRAHLPGMFIVYIGIAGALGAFLGAWVLSRIDIALPKEVFGIAVLVLIIAVSARDVLNMPFLRRRAISFRASRAASASASARGQRTIDHASDGGAVVVPPNTAADSTSRWSLLMPGPRVLGPVSGFLVGLFITALAVGGPLLVMFFLSQKMNRQAVRISMAMFFVFMMMAVLSGYAVNGLITEARMPLIGVCLVAATLGALIGDRIAQYLSDAIWRHAVVVIVLTTSAAALVREVSKAISGYLG